VLKILLFTPNYRPDTGGIVEVSDRLFRLLNTAETEAQIVVASNVIPGRLEFSGQDRVWRAGIPSSLFYHLSLRGIVGLLARGIGILWQLFRFMRHQRVEAVIVIYPSAEAWPFLVLHRLIGVPLILSCHGNDLLTYDGSSFLHRAVLRGLLRAADEITVTAPHLEPAVSKIAPRRDRTAWLIPNCVDTDSFVPRPSELTRRDDAVRLLHVSIFTPKKRTGDIVHAFARATLPFGSKLLMVGAGPEYDSTRQLAASLGLDGRIEFAGLQEDVRALLWNADVLVTASDEESGPLVLLEAMASAVPWIATNWGIAAMLPDGECGVIVPARSPDRLAAAITELASQPEKRRKMGERGRQRAIADFGVQKYRQRHLELLAVVRQAACIAKPESVLK